MNYFLEEFSEDHELPKDSFTKIEDKILYFAAPSSIREDFRKGRETVIPEVGKYQDCDDSICMSLFSKTIDGALSIASPTIGDEVFVYRIANYDFEHKYQPSFTICPYVDIAKVVCVFKPIDVLCIGKVNITGEESEVYEFGENNNETGIINRYTWEWKEVLNLQDQSAATRVVCCENEIQNGYFTPDEILNMVEDIPDQVIIDQMSLKEWFEYYTLRCKGLIEYDQEMERKWYKALKEMKASDRYLLGWNPLMEVTSENIVASSNRLKSKLKRAVQLIDLQEDFNDDSIIFEEIAIPMGAAMEMIPPSGSILDTLKVFTKNPTEENKKKVCESIDYHKKGFKRLKMTKQYCEWSKDLFKEAQKKYPELKIELTDGQTPEDILKDFDIIEKSLSNMSIKEETEIIQEIYKDKLGWPKCQYCDAILEYGDDNDTGICPQCGRIHQETEENSKFKPEDFIKDNRYPVPNKKYVQYFLDNIGRIQYSDIYKEILPILFSKAKEYGLTYEVTHPMSIALKYRDQFPEVIIVPDYIGESTTNNRTYIHLSNKNLNNKRLEPKVPSNFLTKNGYEDSITKRVCFSTSIRKALRGMSRSLKGEKLFVHVPVDVNNDAVIKPTINQVPDVKLTDEVWFTKSVKLKCIGVIEVTDSYGDGLKYSYGKNNEYSAELYDWNYEWTERFGNMVIESGLSTKERNELSDDAFGLPKDRKYPLIDKEHVLQAIRWFNKCEPKKRKELARNIRDKVYEYDMVIHLTKANKLCKYVDWDEDDSERFKVQSENSVLENALLEIYQPTRNMKPVYILLTTTGSPMSKAIRKVTGDDYTHASLSFDLKMDEIYSFNIEGFVKESLDMFKKKFGNIKMGVFCAMVPEDGIRLMKEKIQYFQDHVKDFSYNAIGLLGVILNTPIISNTKLFCSEFVDGMLKLGNVDATNKNSALVRPQEFAQTNVIFKLFDGRIDDYSKKKCEINVNKIRRSLPVNEAVSPIDIDDKYLIIRDPRIKYEEEYQKSHKLLLSYDKTDNIEGMKFEVAKLWYLNNKIEETLNRKLPGKKRQSLLNTRARILNDFNTYLTVITSSDSSFSLTEYIKSTPFNTGEFKIQKSTLLNGISVLKQLI